MEDPTSDVPVPGPLERAAPSGEAPPPGLRVRARARLRRALRAARSWRPRHGWWAAVGLVAAALVVSVGFGVTTASVQGALGPHVTRYDVTTDATITIDFGPLGALELDSPLPLRLGLRATVGEIPASVTELGEARTLEALSGDLTAYVSFFSGPAAAVRDVAYALANDALARSALAFVVLVTAWWVARLLLGASRRHELGALLRAHARPLTAASLALVVGATVLTSSVAPGARPAQVQLASSVFDGTPLEGARVTGRLGGVIDTYGAYAVDAWRENEAFYRGADDALVLAWQEWEDDEVRLAEEAAEQEATRRAAAQREARQGALDGEPEGAAPGDAASDGTVQDGAVQDGAVLPDAPTGDDVPDGAAGAAGEAATDDSSGNADGTALRTPTASAAVSATPTPSPTPEVDPIVLVVVSDLHCNVGMAPLIGTLARLTGAEAVLDAGDTTMNGTSVEQYCVTSFARAVPPGVALVTSPGNHDSRDTSAQYASAGAIVLDGAVVEVGGVRILGDSDPHETRVGGGGTASVAEETPGEMGERLAEVACDDGAVDLLLVHTPAVGDAALDDGCVGAQVSGHFHRRTGPEQVGLGVRYISSSTAGATLGQPTVGPLRGVAELTVLRLDPESRRIVEYQVVQVRPDASVTVERPRPWPRVVEPHDDDDATPAAEDDAAPAAEDDATPAAEVDATPVDEGRSEVQDG